MRENISLVKTPKKNNIGKKRLIFLKIVKKSIGNANFFFFFTFDNIFSFKEKGIPVKASMISQTRDEEPGTDKRASIESPLFPFYNPRAGKGFATDPVRIVRHNLLSANRSGRRCKTCANTRPRDLMPAPARRWIPGVVFRSKRIREHYMYTGICSGWRFLSEESDSSSIESYIPSHRGPSCPPKVVRSDPNFSHRHVHLVTSVEITFSSTTTGSTQANKRYCIQEKRECELYVR